MNATGDRASAAPRGERILAGFVATVGCVVFAVAACVDPYDGSGRPRRHETHLQLGLPPCVLLSTVGFPCPSCGMTTSVSLLAHGDPVAAWRANWAGLVVGAAGLAATVWLGLLAGGIPRRARASAEATILAVTLLGATAVGVRYVAIVVIALAGGAAP